MFSTDSVTTFCARLNVEDVVQRCDWFRYARAIGGTRGAVGIAGIHQDRVRAVCNVLSTQRQNIELYRVGRSDVFAKVLHVVASSSHKRWGLSIEIQKCRCVFVSRQYSTL